MNLFSAVIEGAGVIGFMIALILIGGMLVYFERRDFVRFYDGKSTYLSVEKIMLVTRLRSQAGDATIEHEDACFSNLYSLMISMHKYRWSPDIFKERCKMNLEQTYGKSLNSRSKWLQWAGNICVTLGMIGTCMGTILALQGFGIEGGRDEAMKKVMNAVSLAFTTTLLGLFAQMILGVMARSLQNHFIPWHEHISGVQRTMTALLPVTRELRSIAMERRKKNEFSETKKTDSDPSFKKTDEFSSVSSSEVESKKELTNKEEIE